MNDWQHEHRIMIAVAEACHRPVEPSYSWHVFDWICWKLRCKYPLTYKNLGIIDLNSITS